MTADDLRGVPAAEFIAAEYGITPDQVRRTTTDDLITRARAEAEARWPIPTDPKTPVQWHDIGMASGFVLGALWHAAQQPSREELARVMREAGLYRRQADAIHALFENGGD